MDQLREAHCIGKELYPAVHRAQFDIAYDVIDRSQPQAFMSLVTFSAVSVAVARLIAWRVDSRVFPSFNKLDQHIAVGLDGAIAIGATLILLFRRRGRSGFAGLCVVAVGAFVTIYF